MVWAIGTGGPNFPKRQARGLLHMDHIYFMMLYIKEIDLYILFFKHNNFFYFLFWEQVKWIFIHQLRRISQEFCSWIGTLGI